MKKLMTLMLGLALSLGCVSVFAQEKEAPKKETKKKSTKKKSAPKKKDEEKKGGTTN
ncbi:MAG: hypothetical protein LAP87_11230 [Acidobacteriia bacterium]|nr:hypothetical protein [Terriglobia bacterium]